MLTARSVAQVGQPAVDLLKSLGCRVVIPEQLGPLKAKNLLACLPGIDGVLASADDYSRSVLTSPEAARLKIISRWGVGYDSIDIQAATEQGIVVAYTPGLLNDAVADYTFGLLLGIARRIPIADSTVRQGQWSAIWGSDVASKTLGIIGCGRIGRAVAQRAVGFNMRVLGYDVTWEAQSIPTGISLAPLDTLLSGRDYVSLHCALTPATRGMIGEPQLRRMKSTAYLVNTARGAMVDEQALARALHEGWIAGAALDVFVSEPLSLNHSFRTAPNLLLSPHQASFARQTGERVSVCAAQAIADLMSGRQPAYVVNPAVFQSAACRVSTKTI